MSIQVGLRMSEDTKKRFDHLCKAQDRSQSSMIRVLIRDAYAKLVKMPGQPVAVPNLQEECQS